MVHVYIQITVILVLHFNSGQGMRTKIALLASHMHTDFFHLGSVYKCALDAGWFTSGEEKHIALAHQLVCAGAVKDGATIHHRSHLKRHSCWEVCLNVSGNDIGCGSLCGYYHVDAHRTRQLGNTGNRKFDFPSGCYDEVAVLVYDYHDIRHKAVAVIRI